MIPGFFAPQILPQPLVHMAVGIPSISNTTAVVPFIIDTGAAFTCIHAIDAIRYFGMTPAELDPATWPDAKTIGGIAGASLYLETTARYGLRTNDGSWEIFDGVIRIGEIRTASTPALLGWDLLKLLKLEIDGVSQTVSLLRLPS